MKTNIKWRFIRWLALLFAVLILLFPLAFQKGNGGGMSAVTANADWSNDAKISVQKYDVHMILREDRKIEVQESVTVKFLRQGLTMFYRSLPTDGARYENIQAECKGNDGFYFYVADNEEVSGFIDINCVGNANAGKTWTYDLSYVMEQGADTLKNGMTVDVVGFGWQVPLNDVTVQVDFPQKPTSSEIYADVFGAESGNKVTQTWSNEGKTLTLYTEKLNMTYSERYDEWVAGGITLEFTLPEGVLESYASTRFLTKDMWKIVLACVAGVVIAVLFAVLLGKKRDVVTVVNISAPDDMDPMKMGKWIDGAVNNEDITSMLYYFANKGYLKIDLNDQDDPTLIGIVDELPSDAPVYEKTLFKGLFDGAKVVSEEKPFEETTANTVRAVKVSALEGKFFQASQTAMKQVPDAPPMYEKKSIFAYVSGPIIGLLLAFLIPFFISKRIGGGYEYYFGAILAIPLFVNALIGYLSENYRFKWKAGKRRWLLILQIIIAVSFTLIFVFLVAEHVMTEYEKAVLCIGVFVAHFATQRALSRTEKYLKALENILGFKQFIVVTEEDKIKFMLEENPELYYKVLPYAQVLGVTDEWEGKFKKLLVQPPSWCVASDLTWFDCYILSRCINRSMTASLARSAAAAANKGAGRFVGRSGGGGSFGGFGGGGFGGGGGGAR